MSDFNSSLPVKTQNDGDIVAKIGDGSTPSQYLGVDSSGKIIVKLDDAAGNALTSQANGGQRALDVQAQSAGPVAPGTAAAFSNLSGGQFNSTLPTLTNTQQASIQLDSRGRVFVTSSNLPVVADTNYGVVGSSTLRTAAEIGNATGAADFNFGAASAQTLRVAALPGNASGLADFNFGAVGAQTQRAAAQIGNATGAADFNFGAASAQTLRAAALIGNAAGLVDYNFGAVGAQTIRVAAEPGNSTGAADFNNGATGAQTQRVAANLAVAGANVTTLNPVPVTLVSTTLGTEVNDYKTASALAAGATDNHDYAITAATTFKGRLFWASGSGKIKAEVQISADGVTFVTKWVGFNSTANPNIEISLDNLTISETGAGSKIRIIITNRDNQAQDVYSTISGTEV